eukprot:evm.model.scf_993.1 EVM.evm.TU.scf_993.1   scf_993:7163-8852(-)
MTPGDAPPPDDLADDEENREENKEENREEIPAGRQDWWLDVFRNGETDKEPELMKCLSCGRVVLASRFGAHVCDRRQRGAQSRRGQSAEAAQAPRRRPARRLRQGGPKDRVSVAVAGRKVTRAEREAAEEKGERSECGAMGVEGGGAGTGAGEGSGGDSTAAGEGGGASRDSRRAKRGAEDRNEARGMEEGHVGGEVAGVQSAFGRERGGQADHGHSGGGWLWRFAEGAACGAGPGGCSEAAAREGVGPAAGSPEAGDGAGGTEMVRPPGSVLAPVLGMARGGGVPCWAGAEGGVRGECLGEWSHLLNGEGALVFPRCARKRRTSRSVLKLARSRQVRQPRLPHTDNSSDVLVNAAPMWCPYPVERLEEVYGSTHQNVIILGFG